MINNFRVKKHKDTETAAETIIDGSSFLNKISLINKDKRTVNITTQLQHDENFDNYIEKRNKEG
ncbi:MAG TPA: hypothetical protein GXX14_00420 [Clostridiaceae bacterium]|nr:hypothetical protein [Clostridiaceae bacterium]